MRDRDEVPIRQQSHKGDRQMKREASTRGGISFGVEFVKINKDYKYANGSYKAILK